LSDMRKILVLLYAVVVLVMKNELFVLARNLSFQKFLEKVIGVNSQSKKG
jgi:hypothetical protein